MKYGLLQSFALIEKANKMTRPEILTLQKERLDDLVSYAREHSPFYNQLFRDLKERPDLLDLPPTNKHQLMQNFDAWVTEPGLKHDKVLQWMSDQRNILRKIDGKWRVYHTSGSSGTVCHVIYDRTADNLTSAANYLRFFTDRRKFIKFILKGAKVDVINTPGFDLDYCKVAEQPFSKIRNRTIDILTSIPEIVRIMNRHQPNMIMSYPTEIELLLPEIRSGRLKIKPDYVVMGGEHTSEYLKQELEHLLGCTAVNGYGCTECGMMSFECQVGHNHINSDWVIVEPVDAEGKPAQPGTQSHKFYLTNLSNFTQPYIRYEVTDRVILHDEPCPCGSPFPWLAVEGRTDDIIEFSGRNGKVRVAPMNLQPSNATAGLVQYQLVQKELNFLEVRLISDDGWEKQMVFEDIKSQLQNYLSANEIDNVNIVLSEKSPERNPVSGKFKAVYKE